MRLFAAFELPAPVRTGIAEAFSRARSLAPRAKWVSLDAMHLTLHFFGEIPDPQVAGLAQAFDNPSLHIPRIPAQLGEVGFFPGGGPPKVLWVGVARGDGEMRGFWGRLTDHLQEMRKPGAPLADWSPDSRGFSPHITVARSGAAPLSREWAAGVKVPPVEFAIERCVLFQSVLGPGGPKYVPLKAIQFQGAAA